MFCLVPIFIYYWGHYSFTNHSTAKFLLQSSQVWFCSLTVTLYLTHLILNLKKNNKIKSRKDLVALMLCKAVRWHSLGSFVLFEETIIANQYKLVLTDHLCPMMKHFYPDGKVYLIVQLLVFCTVLSITNTNWENIFYKNSVHRSSTDPEMRRICQCALKLFWWLVNIYHCTM